MHFLEFSQEERRGEIATAWQTLTNQKLSGRRARTCGELLGRFCELKQTARTSIPDFVGIFFFF